MALSAYYHYCDIDACFNILRTGQLWLSGVNNMNDHAELRWTYRKLAQCLDRRAGRVPAAQLDRLWDAFQAGGCRPFICAFSEGGDLLSHWRGYADEGYGLSIGFDARWLPPLREPEQLDFNRPDNLGLYPVVYDEQEQERRLEQLLDEALRDGDLVGATALFNAYAVTFKNPAFAEERELRLVHIPHLRLSREQGLEVQAISPLRQRILNKRLYTYFEYRLPEQSGASPILELVLGPKCEADDYDLRLLLASHGYPGVRIRRSAATLR